MGRKACTEPQCLYKGALYLTSVPVQGCTLRFLPLHSNVQGDTKEREILKWVVAVKECIRGGGRHLQDVIFKQ